MQNSKAKANLCPLIFCHKCQCVSMFLLTHCEHGTNPQISNAIYQWRSVIQSKTMSIFAGKYFSVLVENQGVHLTTGMKHWVHCLRTEVKELTSSLTIFVRIICHKANSFSYNLSFENSCKQLQEKFQSLG